MAKDEEINYPIYNGPCKIIHHEPYYTPNNYDLYFDYDNIPANIKPIDAANLEKRLQKLMPLSKIIHVNMRSDALDKTNHLNIHTSLNIYGNVSDSKVSIDDDAVSYAHISDLNVDAFIVGCKFENNQLIVDTSSLDNFNTVNDLCEVIIDIKYENGVLKLIKFEPSENDETSLNGDKLINSDFLILENAIIDLKYENGMLIGVRGD